jgi:hypothetical protein
MRGQQRQRGDGNDDEEGTATMMRKGDGEDTRDQMKKAQETFDVSWAVL